MGSVVVVLVLALAAGCGGDDSGGPTDGGAADAVVADSSSGDRDAGDVEGDGGTGTDGGPALDAGALDAGTDGGESLDAGGPVDGGDPVDAGMVDAGPLTCSSCHGDSDSPAPPLDTAGGSATTLRGVGAHRAHLRAAGWHRQVRCEDCHVVPTEIGAAGHLDTPRPAELTWSALATSDGASPSMAGDSCVDSYCHGATLLPGGILTEPVWTRVDGSQAYCGSCHGLPPGGGHPDSIQCQLCHPTMSAPTVFADPSRHIDGIVDVDVSCTSCHGDATSPAPPSDTSGGTSTDLRSVGAHRSHLGGSGWHREVVCQDCHQVPSSVGSPGHMDTPLPAELTWSPLAGADGASPAMSGDTCSSVYCHGATLLPGGTNTEPVWTTVDGSQAACGSCHGLPPGGSHVGLTNCEMCHGAVIDASGAFVAPELHVDGIVQAVPIHAPGWSAPGAHGATVNADGFAACQGCHGTDLLGGLSGVSCESCHPGWSEDCTFCHGGTLDTTGAPPEGVNGETVRTTIQVGAHAEHVSDTSMHLAWDCDACHVTPLSATTPGHIDGDGVAEVTFGWLNPAATYDYATGTCASLYCHGNGSSILGTAVWNTDPTLDCGSCHADFFSPSSSDLRAMSGEHDRHVDREGYGCDTCHSAVVGPSGALLRIDLHVNGNVDVAVPSYDPTGDGGRGTCEPACHGSETWR